MPKNKERIASVDSLLGLAFRSREAKRGADGGVDHFAVASAVKEAVYHVEPLLDEPKHGQIVKDVAAMWQVAMHEVSADDRKRFMRGMDNNPVLESRAKDVVEDKHVPTKKEIAAIRERLIERGHSVLLRHEK